MMRAPTFIEFLQGIDALFTQLRAAGIYSQEDLRARLAQIKKNRESKGTK